MDFSFSTSIPNGWNWSWGSLGDIIMAKLDKRLGDGSNPCEDLHDNLGHVVPVATYNKVFGALLFLTLITVLAASLEVGVMAHIFLAMSIATVKAALVIYIFMHLKFESKTYYSLVACPIIVMFLLFLGTLGDLTVKESPVPSSLEQVSHEMPSTVEHH